MLPNHALNHLHHPCLPHLWILPHTIIQFRHWSSNQSLFNSPFYTLCYLCFIHFYTIKSPKYISFCFLIQALFVTPHKFRTTAFLTLSIFLIPQGYLIIHSYSSHYRIIILILCLTTVRSNILHSNSPIQLFNIVHI